MIDAAMPLPTLGQIRTYIGREVMEPGDEVHLEDDNAPNEETILRSELLVAEAALVAGFKEQWDLLDTPEECVEYCSVGEMLVFVNEDEKRKIYESAKKLLEEKSP